MTNRIFKDKAKDLLKRDRGFGFLGGLEYVHGKGGEDDEEDDDGYSEVTV